MNSKDQYLLRICPTPFGFQDILESKTQSEGEDNRFFERLIDVMIVSSQIESDQMTPIPFPPLTASCRDDTISNSPGHTERIY